MQTRLLPFLSIMKPEKRKHIVIRIVLSSMRYHFLFCSFNLLKIIPFFSVFCVRNKNNFRELIKKEYPINGCSDIKYFEENFCCWGIEYQFIKHMDAKL
jgi:hypothetical protein